MSLFNLTVNYTSSVKYAAIAAWTASHAYSLGDIVRRLSGINATQGNVFFCYQAGTSGGTEPTWSGNRGQSTTDNTAKWIEMGGQPAFNGDATNTNRWSSVNHVGVDLGNIIKDASGNGFICTVSATNGTSEPTWNTTLGATTTDGGVTWMSIGAISGYANWANPHPSLRNAVRTGWGFGGAGTNPILQQAYFSHDHSGVGVGNDIISDTTPAAPSTGLDMICVNSSGSVPPVSADLATTGVETASGNSVGLEGYFRYIYGLNITITGSSNGTLGLNNNGNDMLCESCKFTLTTTGSGAVMNFSTNGLTRMVDCTFTFGATGQTFRGAGRAEFIGGSIGATGSVPTTLISQFSAAQLYLFDGVDLSGLTATTLVGGNSSQACQYDFVDCKMPSSYTVSNVNGASANFTVSVVRCSSTGNLDQYQGFMGLGGNMSSDATVVRTGGASGVNPYSLKMVTDGKVNSGANSLNSPPIIQPNSTTGADVMVTVHGIVNAAAVPTTFDVWLEVSYLGTSGNTHTTHTSSHPLDYLLSTVIDNLTADTSAWDTKATARANSHAYSVGDVIALASNPNRIFFCTSAGTSASSEPGGYASAVDGGSVTDSGATFRAGCRFRLDVVLTHPQPEIAGNLTASVRIGKASTTYYIDPLLTLS